MAINTCSITSETYVQDTATVRKDEKAKGTQNLGKTIGKPELSQEAQRYYEKLKKKYGNYDFILVSEDQKEYAKANASKYANQFKTVVLIDEEKIERMATDEKFRKQYEDILSGAASQLQQLKANMEKSGAQVQGYGIQVNDGGTLSFFAVLKKSSAEQKVRIEKVAEKKRIEKKAAEKKVAERKAFEKKVSEKKKVDKKDSERSVDLHRGETQADETVTLTGNSIEELMSKLGDYVFETRSNTVQTDSERMLGQHIDFRG